MWTKRQLVDQAFIEIGKSPKVFNIDPEDLQDALSIMEGMLGEWNGNGIRLGYALSSSPEAADIDADSGLPDWANSAAYLNLALRLAPSHGKQVAPSTLTAARAAYRTLLSRSVTSGEQQQTNTMPRGAGNRRGAPPLSPFFPTPADPILAGDDGPLDFT